MFLDVVEGDTSLLGVLNIDVERRVRAKPGVADALMREERSLVEGLITSQVRQPQQQQQQQLQPVQLGGPPPPQMQPGGAGSGLQKEGARQREEAAD